MFIFSQKKNMFEKCSRPLQNNLNNSYEMSHLEVWSCFLFPCLGLPRSLTGVVLFQS